MNSGSERVISCRDLSVGYKQKAVLSGLNLDFEQKHFISLLGPNGAGKTTLLRTLSRHLPPIGGTIRVNGRPLEDIPQQELARVMAVVLTDKVSPPLLTVFEFVSLGRYPHTDFLGRLKAHDHAAILASLAAVRAEHLAQRQYADLSDGERQKALVARALAQEPRLLLLDEPTLHLDLKHRMEVMAILRGLCRIKGITVVASLHDVDIAAKVSDRVALIKHGGVTAWGPPEEILQSRTVKTLYDFDGASFDMRLGGVELRGDGRKGKVFVVAGLGSGAIIYRLLSKRGFAIATGVLHANDLDCYVARSLGALCAVQTPTEPDNGAALREAVDHLEDCDCVIDTGFAVGDMNRQNVELLRTARDRGAKIFTLRQNGLSELLGPNDEQIVVCADAVRLLDALEGHLEERQKEHRHLKGHL